MKEKEIWKSLEIHRGYPSITKSWWCDILSVKTKHSFLIKPFTSRDPVQGLLLSHPPSEITTHSREKSLASKITSQMKILSSLLEILPYHGWLQLFHTSHNTRIPLPCQSPSVGLKQPDYLQNFNGFLLTNAHNCKSSRHWLLITHSYFPVLLDSLVINHPTLSMIHPKLIWLGPI